MNEQETEETTALMKAASEGCSNMVKALIEKGADVDARDKAGRTPLSFAIEHVYEPAATLLRKHGARE